MNENPTIIVGSPRTAEALKTLTTPETEISAAKRCFVLDKAKVMERTDNHPARLQRMDGTTIIIYPNGVIRREGAHLTKAEQKARKKLRRAART